MTVIVFVIAQAVCAHYGIHISMWYLVWAFAWDSQLVQRRSFFE